MYLVGEVSLLAKVMSTLVIGNLGLPLTKFFVIRLSYRGNCNDTYDLILQLTLSVSVVQFFHYIPETEEGELDLLSVHFPYSFMSPF